MGFDVLLEEALQRRQEVYDEYLTPICFNTNTLHCDVRIVKSFTRNKKRGSVVKVFMEVPVAYEGHKHMFIPLKYNKGYHGAIDDYNSTKSNNHIYCNIVINSNQTVNVNIASTKTVAHRAPTNSDKVIGIDVNTNGDLLVMSNGSHIKHKNSRIVGTLSDLFKK